MYKNVLANLELIYAHLLKYLVKKCQIHLKIFLTFLIFKFYSISVCMNVVSLKQQKYGIKDEIPFT